MLLQDRLRAARDALFVGREEEQALFRSVLATEDPPVNMLYVVGPGGVGKTSLLRAFQREARAAGVHTVYLDAREVEPAPEAFSGALARTLALPDGADLGDAIASYGEPCVLLIDTCEAIAGLDVWLREQFLPALPERTRVVMAGRSLPSEVWRTDPGWQALVHVVPLRNLGSEASRRFLERRAVPKDQHEAVLAFTRGHPLATSLVADLLDQKPGLRFEPHQAPGMLQTLLEQFVQHVPGPAHRAALEACALVRFMTEGLLQTMLAMPDAHGLFAWLRGLSFVDAGARGLFPHDLAREVLAADLLWRNPDWHAELHGRARRFYTDRLQRPSAFADREVLSDYAFLYRNHPLVRPLFMRLQSQWENTLPLQTDTLRAGDGGALIAMVDRHEGPDAARIAEHWMTRQPAAVTVYRDGGAAPAGFSMALALDATTPEERAADPAAAQAWAYLQAHAPLRPGERATFFRFWMAREVYQQVSPVQSLVFLGHVRHYLHTPRLAFSFLPCHDAALWSFVFRFAGMHRLADVDFETDGHAFAVFGHDWRAVPPGAWLNALAESRLGAGPAAAPPPARPEPIVVLSRDAFEEAVREAFRAYARPGRLRGNPLLRSRLVADAVAHDADEATRIEALQRLLGETSARLQADPRDARYHRAIDRTYLRPAPTQEQAAEQIGVPFSTFRRHLKRGLERVTALLWEQEIGMG